MSSLPPNGAEGEALRDAALAVLRVHRSELVRALQITALRVALQRGTVTADDVRGLVEIPTGTSPKVVGAAFRDLALSGILRRTGYQNSTRAKAHARPLTVWALADAAGAAAWLAAHPPLATV